MEDSREYQLTRSRSRLHDHFPALPQADTSEITQSNYGYPNIVKREPSARIIAYRENIKREYTARYRRLSTEDAYARRYDATYLYSRRGVYSHEYGVYNMRPKPPMGPKSVRRDSGYVDHRGYGTSRRNDTRVGEVRRSINNTRSTRSAARRRNRVSKKALASAELPGSMQMRYSVKRPTDDLLTTTVDEVSTITEPLDASETVSVTRIRPFSTRIAQRLAATLQAAMETEEPTADGEVAVEAPTDIKSEDVDVNVPQEELSVVTVEAQVTHTPEESVVEHTTDAPADGGAANPEIPIKRKRGRPKIVRPDVSNDLPPAKTEKVKRPRPTIVKSGVAGQPKAPLTPKRTSARIRSNNLALSYAISTRLADDMYEEQLKKAIAMSMKEAGNNVDIDDLENGLSGDGSIHIIMKNKDGKGVIADEDLKDVDYIPSSPTRSAKRAATKDRYKSTSRPTMTTSTSTPISKMRSTRRGKDGRFGGDSAVRIDGSTQTEPTEDTAGEVAVVDDGADSEKMLFFEEYLEMSERMYCGRPLCVRQLPDATEAKKGEESAVADSSDDEGMVNLDAEPDIQCLSPERRVDSERSKRMTTRAAVCSSDNDSTNADGFFDFQCSDLDLRFRVSFAMLTSDLRQPQVLDLWGPKEIVLFELGMFKHGKEFYEIQRTIPTKTVQEIVDMYYLWKKTNRYKLWKANRQY
ncbi:uncharacterized protein BXIN_1043 [Babesia sp. Xinjiang]|uniref:uncharacterized protein n=1 Tax=Babesia sp. Xinjiang TaxID=462227 RepID=UPI000A21CB51|nr:uncharacterized protein BXIN_1043 [Babesia sp. Xinjiang]ORM42000.1 hypothetical protein BXIN_1043 [Babesia sp. Xinjiang]